MGTRRRMNVAAALIVALVYSASVWAAEPPAPISLTLAQPKPGQTISKTTKGAKVSVPIMTLELPPAGTVKIEFVYGTSKACTAVAPDWFCLWETTKVGAWTITASAKNAAGVELARSRGETLTIVVVAPAPPPPPVVVPPVVVQPPVVVPPPVVAPPPSATPSGKLLQAADLSYLGSFRGPQWNGADPAMSVDYGGYGLAFNAEHGSLFVIGHTWRNYVSEISIPAALSADPAKMARATFLQAPADITEGKRFGDLLTGLLVYHGRLIASSRISYDANHSQNALKKSHYVSGLNLATVGDALGPLEVTAAATNFLTGYMATVPQAWQAALGGPALTGWCCGPSIIGRTSQGPAAYAFDPDQLGVVDPVPGTALVYYPLDHPTLGDWRTAGSLSPWPPVPGQATNLVYNGTAEINGLAFPEGTRSVLFFGFIGQGTFCYGDATPDPTKVYALYGDPALGLRNCVYIPGSSAGGQHTYYSIDGKGGLAPTLFQVWAYDAADLALVKAGTKKPWDVAPYAYWTLNVPVMDFAKGSRARGVAYDPAGQRLFLYQQQYGETFIHVFQVKVP